MSFLTGIRFFVFDVWIWGIWQYGCCFRHVSGGKRVLARLCRFAPYALRALAMSLRSIRRADSAAGGVPPNRNKKKKNVQIDLICWGLEICIEGRWIFINALWICVLLTRWLVLNIEKNAILYYDIISLLCWCFALTYLKCMHKSRDIILAVAHNQEEIACLIVAN